MMWMSLFLLYIIFTESLGSYMFYVLKKPNTVVYAVYQAVSVCFYSYLFYALLPDKKIARKIIAVSAFLIAVSILIVTFFVADRVELLYRLKIILCIDLSIVSCYYLYCEFMEEKPEESLIKNTGFWIATGLLLFNSAYSIVITMHPYTSKNKVFLFGLPIHNFFANILSVFLYSCLSIAMIVWKPKTKSA